MPVTHHSAPTSAFPLAWPDGYPRTPSLRRKEARFRAPLGATIRLIRDELTALHARNVVVSTNLPTRNDGMPYASGRLQTDDPGAAVYWFQPKTRRSYVLACDCWASVGENLRAIALSLQAMRALERWGVSEIQERTFAGFQALPAPAEPEKPDPFRDAHTRDELDRLWRSAVHQYHPDAGGSEEAFHYVMARYDEAARRLDPCPTCLGLDSDRSQCSYCRGKGYRQ